MLKMKSLPVLVSGATLHAVLKKVASRYEINVLKKDVGTGTVMRQNKSSLSTD
jgi:hypothetical protein